MLLWRRFSGRIRAQTSKKRLLLATSADGNTINNSATKLRKQPSGDMGLGGFLLSHLDEEMPIVTSGLIIQGLQRCTLADSAARFRAVRPARSQNKLLIARKGYSPCRLNP